jgi:hypothetical protein
MSLARRAASRILRGAVRLAPVDTRRWGTAMLSELDHVEGELAALRWALGGSTAVCRHALTHGRALRTVALGGALLALALLLFASSRGTSVSESRPAPTQSAARPRTP